MESWCYCDKFMIWLNITLFMRLKLSQVYFHGQCREEMDHYLFSISDSYRILPCIVCTRVFGPNFQEKSFLLIFKFNYLFIYI